MRPLLLLLAAAPLAAQVRPPQSQHALSPFQQQKAGALLRDRLPCLGCHELDGSGGRVGPRLTDVHARRGAEYVRSMIEDPQRTVPGSAMPKTPMPEATRALVVAYLTRSSALAGATRTATPIPPADTTTSGTALYAKWCSSCHGAKGGGDGPNARYLPVRPAVHASAASMSARSDDALFDAIAGGGPVMGKSARMPAFGATLAPEQIRALVAYIRHLCACNGPAWSRDGASR